LFHSSIKFVREKKLIESLSTNRWVRFFISAKKGKRCTKQLTTKKSLSPLQRLEIMAELRAFCGVLAPDRS
jgi:hypothetical protein